MTDLERLCQAAQRAGLPMKSAKSYEPIVKAVLEELGLDIDEQCHEAFMAGWNAARDEIVKTAVSWPYALKADVGDYGGPIPMIIKKPPA